MMRSLSRAEGIPTRSRETVELIREAEKYGGDTSARILIVDGDEVTRGLLESLLSEAGHQMLSCLDSQEAIAKLREGSFDLVITDLSMSRADGFDILRKAKELDPSREVIVVTPYSSLESAVEAMKLGAYDYISKPFNMDQIRIVIDKALEKRRLLQAAQQRDFYKQLTRIDVFTGLYDVRAFHDVLEAEIARSERHLHPISLLLVGLDGLEVDSDILEDSMGDAVLREVACLIKKSVRKCDFVASYGRDKFAIILVEAEKTDAITVANRVRRLVEETSFQDGDVLADKDDAVTISVGIASYPIDAVRPMDLVTKADRALDEAKALGGNLVRSAEAELVLMGTYREKRLYFLFKRCMDITLSLLFVTLTFPLFLFIALLIKLDSSGPVFFKQRRVGLRKRAVAGKKTWELAAFNMYKFRTMHLGCDRSKHWQFMKALIQDDEGEVARLLNNSDSVVKKLSRDPRITRVGKVLRKTSLDELPQFWNVIRGEMSLVGPRPPIVYELANYEPRHWKRLEAIPGCTGLWQVSGWCTLGFAEQVELDIQYIEHQSLRLDIKILLKTLPAILSAKGGR